ASSAVWQVAPTPLSDFPLYEGKDTNIDYPKSLIRPQCSKTLAIALFPNIFYFLVGILPVFVT
ncbi:MAG: hypothetical protein KIG82_04560, partial [Prevotella sp.]|nr:hypothetical protein [Prevotella sp.]